jgi:hypothetical protein
MHHRRTSECTKKNVKRIHSTRHYRFYSQETLMNCGTVQTEAASVRATKWKAVRPSRSGVRALMYTEQPQLVETALRVLSRWSNGQEPTLLDVQLLRQHALPNEAALEPDELACATVAREFRKTSRLLSKRRS